MPGFHSVTAEGLLVKAVAMMTEWSQTAPQIVPTRGYHRCIRFLTPLHHVRPNSILFDMIVLPDVYRSY